MRQVTSFSILLILNIYNVNALNMHHVQQMRSLLHKDSEVTLLIDEASTCEDFIEEVANNRVRCINRLLSSKGVESYDKNEVFIIAGESGQKVLNLDLIHRNAWFFPENLMQKLEFEPHFDSKLFPYKIINETAIDIWELYSRHSLAFIRNVSFNTNALANLWVILHYYIIKIMSLNPH